MNSINEISYVFIALDLFEAQRVALLYVYKYVQIVYKVVKNVFVKKLFYA